MFKKAIKHLGWIATLTSVSMYVAYIPQILNNLNNQKGNPIQPLVAAINCSLWVIYGLFKPHRDWPLVVANAPRNYFRIDCFFDGNVTNKKK